MCACVRMCACVHVYMWQEVFRSEGMSCVKLLGRKKHNSREIKRRGPRKGGGDRKLELEQQAGPL